MIVLLIDAGNSRVKWALADGDVWLHQGKLEHSDIQSLRNIFPELPRPQKALVSNVAGKSMMQQLLAACSQWSCPITFISAKVEQCGVRNLYDNAEQLGSDRWAALIAAHHTGRSAWLVVDCGTATTVDALSADGQFLGGLILPGIDMMRQSLAAGSVQLTDNKNAGAWHEFPRNTSDAIFSGAIQATVGAIKLQFEALAVRAEARCLLSGGAADFIYPHLKLPVTREDNLVLHGLYIIGQNS